jgi:hypothetical protein
MARVKGGYLGGIYDIPKKQPLDSRMLVTKRVDLINPSVWKTNGSTTGEFGHYNGMIVSVNSDGIYNGVYYLTDRTAITDGNYSAYKTALAAGEDINPYFSMWVKLGTLDDIATVEKNLKALIAEVKPAMNLVPVDGTIVIADDENGDKTISVAIAPIDGNALVAVEGGLFVPAASVKIADNSHGLVAVDGALALALATKDSDGAMSKEDKALLDAIPNTYATSKRVDDLEAAVSNLEKSCLWGEM